MNSDTHRYIMQHGVTEMYKILTDAFVVDAHKCAIWYCFVLDI